MKKFYTQQLIVNSLSHFVGTKLFCLTTIACFVFTFLNTSTVRGQQADAINAVQICNGIWPEPAATANTGSVSDLATVTSRGCLIGGETGSNWYWVKVTAPGVMAFNVQGITATGTVADIDGSIFGPFTSVAAGAAAITGGSLAPMRCSYAVATGFELKPGITETTESDTGDGLIAPVTVATGQYYIIFVDNFNANNTARAVSISWNFTAGNTALYECPAIPTTCGPSCSTATCPVADRGIMPASGVQVAATFTYAQCNSYSSVPFKAGDGTFSQCYLVNSDGYGNLGVMQQITVKGTDANADNIADCYAAIAASRTATLTLASNPCGTAIAASRASGGNNAFNPEWDNLLPNTSYILCISTTMPAITAGVTCNYRKSCVDVYHYVPPPAALYPACVTPAPKWWYKANAGVSTTTNAVAVDFWNDQSGSTQNVAQTAAARPTFNTTGINFNPSLNFSGTQSLFRAAATGLTGANKTILSVALPTTLPAGTAGIIGAGASAAEIDYGYLAGKLNVFENAANNASATTANVAATVILSTAIENTNVTSFFNNGVANGTGPSALTSVTNRLTIGAHNLNNVNKNFFTGQIAEIIVFDRAISATERANAESYLAIKYGVTLGHDYTNSLGTVLYPIASFANRITVIGREDCQNLNQKQSKSVNAGNWTMGLKTIATTNALNLNTFSTNNTFLALGDDNGAMAATTLAAGGACAPPVGTDVEIPRHWKTVVTGTMDSVFMQIPSASWSGLDLNQPVYMVIADDAAFTTNVRNVLMTKNGTNYEKKLLFSGTQYFKLIGTGVTTTYCTGSSFLQWSANPWTAGALTKTIALSNGLSVTTTVANPNGIMLAGYPAMVGTQPVMFINSNSATKIVTWSMQFNQTITGAGFYLYDVDRIGTLNENIQITGYKGATAVLPTLSKSALSTMVLDNATGTVTGGLNNIPTYNPAARAYVSFNSAIDKIVITYKNNANTIRNTTAAMAIGDISIYCPEPVVEPDLVGLKKIVQTAAVHQNDTVSYTFKLNNTDCAAKTIDVTDNLPAGLQWVANSYTSTLTGGTLNSYGGTTAFTLTGISVPVGVSTFTVDAVATASGVKNNQANFVVNGNTYPSDDPNQAGLVDVTPLSISAPLTIPPVTITKAVASPTVLGTGTQTFTYTLNNIGATPITMNFADEMSADTMSYVAASLSATLGGTALAYAGQGSLFITGMSVPVGTSTFSVQVAMNSIPSGTYQNTATIAATGAAYNPNPIASNTVYWDVAAAASFNYVFNCMGSTVAGTFIANGIPNQTGTITLPINVIVGGLVVVTVAGTNFTGTLTTTVAAGQSSLTIPVVYNGGGTEGSRLLTITSPAGVGTCTVSVPIQAACKANGGRIGQ
jgi:large repetitive protein